ncbi:unnamed protein product [Gordionus sp. m RMFG-2023]
MVSLRPPATTAFVMFAIVNRGCLKRVHHRTVIWRAAASSLHPECVQCVAHRLSCVMVLQSFHILDNSVVHAILQHDDAHFEMPSIGYLQIYPKVEAALPTLMTFPFSFPINEVIMHVDSSNNYIGMPTDRLQSSRSFTTKSNKFSISNTLPHSISIRRRFRL